MSGRSTTPGSGSPTVHPPKKAPLGLWHRAAEEAPAVVLPGLEAGPKDRAPFVLAQRELTVGPLEELALFARA